MFGVVTVKTLRVFFFGIIICISIFCSSTFAAVIYVDAGIEESGDGTTWGDAANGESDDGIADEPYSDLQAAITAAVIGDQIWVKSGTYTPGTERTSSFQMKNGVAIYGGFTGGETLLVDRNITENVTILSGDIGTPDVNSDNCYHVFSHIGLGLDSTAVLDGFTISGGNADGSTPDDYGGGMINSVSLSTFVDGSSPLIKNCTFYGNTASSAGGGVANYSTSSPILEFCTFDGNNAILGGGLINLDAASPAIIGCMFMNNSASYGAGVYNTTWSLKQTPNPSISDSTFLKNNASDSGGAIFSYASIITISSSCFKGNSATDGGAVFNSDDTAINIINSLFSLNDAENIGAALYNQSDTPSCLVNCSISSNNAKINGGGIYNTGSALLVKNTIVWKNLINGRSVDNTTSGIDSEIKNNTGTVTVDYSNVWRAEPTIVYPGNNKNTDPLFFKAPDYLKTDYGDLHLRSKSTSLNPMIGGGILTDAPDDDFDGETRIDDPDIGADEFVDTDGDGMPNYWENMYEGLNSDLDDGGGDIDHDGVTNIDEYLNGYNPGENVSPVAVIDVKPSLTVAGDSPVTLNSASYDVDDTITAWLWEPIAPNTIIPSDADTSTANFIAPTVAKGEVAELRFKLTVWSGISSPQLKGETTCTITVKDLNISPTLTVGSWNVPVGDSGNGYVKIEKGNTLTGLADAYDDDEDDILTISASGMPAGSSIDPETGSFSMPVVNAGTFYVIFNVTDNGSPLMGASKRIAVVVTDGGIGNSPPVFNFDNPIPVSVEGTFNFITTAVDADGDDLTFSISDMPPGAVYNTETGLFTWDPEGVPGNYSVLFTVFDGKGGSDYRAVTLTVGDGNLPPVLTTIGPQFVLVGEPLSFTVTASDPDDPSGSGLSFLTSTLPVGASFNEETQVFTWNTQAGMIGEYDVVFTVVDSDTPAGSDSEEVRITVDSSPIDHPPELDPIGNKHIDLNENLSFQINATDPDGDDILYTGIIQSVDARNDGAEFDSQTKIFSWPNPTIEGVFEVTFTAAANSKQDSETIFISVGGSGNVNRPPAFLDIGLQSCRVGDTIAFKIIAIDPDGDPMIYKVPPSQKGTFNSDTGDFSWATVPGDVNTYTFKFGVYDGTVNIWTNITIVVGGVSEPVLSHIGNKAITWGETVSFKISATDSDGEHIRYEVAGFPQNSTAMLDYSSGDFLWVTKSENIGDHVVTFIAISGIDEVTETITITIKGKPPVIEELGGVAVEDDSVFSYELKEGELFNLPVESSDPDPLETDLVYSATLIDGGQQIELPARAACHSSTGDFSWTPETGSVGTYTIRLVVTDSESMTDEIDITLTVNPGENEEPGPDPEPGVGGSGGSSGCFINSIAM